MLNFRIILCGILMASAVFTFLIPVFLWGKHNKSILYFSIFSVSLSFYSFGYAMELFAFSLDSMAFWNLAQYVGLPFIPALWVVFTMEYNNLNLRLFMKIAVFFVPCLTLILRFTNDRNHLFYYNIYIKMDNGFPTLFIVKGPWYWVHLFYLTVCFVVANYYYIKVYLKSAGDIKQQSFLMLIASLLPWLSAVTDVLNIAPFNIDYGPFMLMSSELILFFAFLRYQFLNIKPLARDKVFESTKDGIIVLDTHQNIIDYNHSAEMICEQLNKNAVGKNVEKVLCEQEGLVHSILACEESQFDLEERKCSYKVNTVKITEHDGRKVGSIVTMTDITKYMEMVAELDLLASRDSLTGVLNRRYFVKMSDEELENCKQDEKAVSMMILDLDHFKNINDTYGHQAGDEVLRTVAELCRNSIRITDILGRYGGEEFVAFLPDTGDWEALKIAEKILCNVSKNEIMYENQCIKVTTSIGITGMNWVDDKSLDYLLKYADKALYQAKEEGRNCVRAAWIN